MLEIHRSNDVIPIVKLYIVITWFSRETTFSIIYILQNINYFPWIVYKSNVPNNKMLVGSILTKLMCEIIYNKTVYINFVIYIFNAF